MGWGWRRVKEGGDTCVPIADSFWCMTEASEILWISFPSIKINKFWGKNLPLQCTWYLFWSRGWGQRCVVSSRGHEGRSDLRCSLKAELAGVCIDLVIYKADFHWLLQAGLYIEITSKQSFRAFRGSLISLLPCYFWWKERIQHVFCSNMPWLWAPSQDSH